MDERTKAALEAISEHLRANSLEAFATGSRLQGLASAESDLDVVVVGDIDADAYEAELWKVVDRELPIDVVAYSAGELVHRLQNNDPFATSMVDSMHNLTLSKSTKKRFTRARTANRTQTEYVENAVALNLESAIRSFCEALLYDAYAYCIAESGDVVPPKRLPEAAVDTVPYEDETLQNALEIKKAAERAEGYSELSALYFEFFELLPDTDRAFRRHR